MGFRPNFISFFSGARGLDLGLEEAGWECLAANEFDRVTCDTIRLNAPELQLYDTDIRELTAGQLQADLGLCGRDLFAIVGGPPCQAFSTAGRRLGLNDARGNVFLHFLDLIGSLKPKYAVFENVRGLLSAPLEHRPHDQRGPGFPKLRPSEASGGALSFILGKLRGFGYSTTFTLYNTANFGVPQARERIIFFASRDGMEIPLMVPTHDAEGRNGLPRWLTVAMLSETWILGTNTRPVFRRTDSAITDSCGKVKTGGTCRSDFNAKQWRAVGYLVVGRLASTGDSHGTSHLRLL